MTDERVTAPACRSRPGPVGRHHPQYPQAMRGRPVDRGRRPSRRFAGVTATSADRTAADGLAHRDASSNGSWHDGARIGPDGVALSAGQTVRIRLGDPDGPEIAITEPSPVIGGGLATVRRRAEPPLEPSTSAAGPGTQLQHQQQAAHPLMIGRITVGRDADNDVHLPDLLVSRKHAELHIDRADAEIVDLGSANGRSSRAAGDPRARVRGRCDHHRPLLLQLEGSRLVEFVDNGGRRFRGRGPVGVRRRETADARGQFRLPARSLLAVVGPSGAGKSTLLNALTGSAPPTPERSATPAATSTRGTTSCGDASATCRRTTCCTPR